MRNSSLVFISLLLALTFFTGTCALSAEQKKITIKIGSYVTPQSVWGKEISKAIKAVKDRSGNTVDIRHMHSGMLGSDGNMLDQVLLGGIQGAGIQTTTLATIVPEANVIEMPFLFNDPDEAYFLLDEVVMPELQKKLDEKGLISSSLIESGFMDMVMSGPVKRPADLKTMKIGSWESPVHIAFWKSQGAAPIPIPATEVFNAYARGMVDSGANTANALITWDKLFGNGLKRDKIFITRIGFCYQAGLLVMNKSFYNSLPPDIREIFKDELDRFTKTLRTKLREAEPDAFRQLQALGYHVDEMTPAEKEVFIKNSQKVYKQMESVIGKKFMKKVLDARAEYRKKHQSGSKKN